MTCTDIMLLVVQVELTICLTAIFSTTKSSTLVRLFFFNFMPGLLGLASADLVFSVANSIKEVSIQSAIIFTILAMILVMWAVVRAALMIDWALTPPEEPCCLSKDDR